jgi:hypothetical protein
MNFENKQRFQVKVWGSIRIAQIRQYKLGVTHIGKALNWMIPNRSKIPFHHPVYHKKHFYAIPN